MNFYIKLDKNIDFYIKNLKNKGISIEKYKSKNILYSRKSLTELKKINEIEMENNVVRYISKKKNLSLVYDFGQFHNIDFIPLCKVYPLATRKEFSKFELTLRDRDFKKYYKFFTKVYIPNLEDENFYFEEIKDIGLVLKYEINGNNLSENSFNEKEILSKLNAFDFELNKLNFVDVYTHLFSRLK